VPKKHQSNAIYWKLMEHD